MKEKGYLKKVFPKNQLKEILYLNMTNKDCLCFLTSVKNIDYIKPIINDIKPIINEKDLIYIIKDLGSINFELLNKFEYIFYFFCLTKKQINKICKNKIPNSFFIRREFVILKKIKVKFIITNDDFHPFDNLKLLKNKR